MPGCFVFNKFADHFQIFFIRYNFYLCKPNQWSPDLRKTAHIIFKSKSCVRARVNNDMLKKRITCF
jgi:hypothetical protein